MLYHKDVHMPEQVKTLAQHTLEITRISQHAHHAAESDDYGVIRIPFEVTFSGQDIIECELTPESKKYVIRQPSTEDDTLHVITVILLRAGEVILKTLWINDALDHHQTLDESKYFNPSEII